MSRLRIDSVMSTICAYDIDLDLSTRTFRSVRFRPVSRQLFSWRQELQKTAEYIRASTDRPIYVCMSGGIDGEVVGRAFLDASIPFEVITLRHTQRTNEHDVAYAIDWCRSNKVKQYLIPFDVTQFFVNDIWRYIENNFDAGTKTYLSYTSMRLMDIAEEMGGIAVIGNGETRFTSVDGITLMDVRLWWYNNIRYIAERCSCLHFPWFFKTTPEIVAAYLNEDLIRLLTRDPTYFACPAQSDLHIQEKPFIYHRYFPDMLRREKNTGWENIARCMPELSVWRDKFHGRQSSILDRPRYISVSDVRRQLGLDI